MNYLQNILTKRQKLVIGLISGTSMDGVDAALVNIKNQGIDTKLELMNFLIHPYPNGLKEKILENSTPGVGRVDELCRLNFLLGEIFSEAVLALLDAAAVKPEEIDFIGSHGQTIQHLPGETALFGHKIKSTLQLGEPSVIAKRTGILTVADFRPADMAVGGQGAPLVPYFDFVMFRSIEKNRGLLNIGGISNLTIMSKDCAPEDVMAFDTGPGNMVIDALMQKLFDKPFDEDGHTAQCGQVSSKLLAFGLEHRFFKQPPPKSTGHEDFGTTFSEAFLAEGTRLNLAPADLITTAAELTAHSIFESYKNFVTKKFNIDELIVSGGGAKNPYIMHSLCDKFKNTSVKFIEEYGIPSEAKEAVCFAVLANETIAGNCNNLPGATGAKKATILGKICF
jgi:anhydro-N-acetylmuramic acid kinase